MKTELYKVERAAEKAAIALLQLHDAMINAHARGEPLREIAKAASVSHETVRRLIRTDQASGS